MQYLKEELRTKILEVSRHEFVSKGFQKSSLRRIARYSGMTTGGIYTYFRSKSDIFENLVYKVVEEWNSRYEFLLSIAGFEKKFISYPDLEQSDSSRSNYHFLVNFVNLYREEMTLLFFKAQGTRFEDFSDVLAKNALIAAKRYLQRNTDINTYYHYRVSDFFLKNIINFNLNMVREMLKQRVSIEEMLIYEEEISSFFDNGWKAILTKHSA